MVIERSNQCNVQSFFFLLKKKESHGKKKLKLCEICGVNFATKKHQLHGSVQSRDHQKSILLSKEDDIALLRSEMNITKVNALY